jgi:hypothetical protein
MTMWRDSGELELVNFHPYGSFPTGGFKARTALSVRRIHYVPTNEQGDGGGAVYSVGGTSYFVGSLYTPVSGKGPARLDFYLDGVRKISGVLSKLWNEQPSNTLPVGDTAVLDALERFMIRNDRSRIGCDIFIHRDYETYQAVAQDEMCVA